MALARLLSKQTILTGIADIDKWTAIERLVDLLAATGQVKDRQAVMNAIIAREKHGSTGVGNGLAVPHARCDTVDDLVVAMGISEKGLDFDSMDGKPCHVVFLTLAPYQNCTKYLQTLAAIASLASNTANINILKTLKNPDDVMAKLNEFEGCLGTLR